VTKVLISGNFNVLHPGHIRLFKLAKEVGNELVVAISSERNNSNKLSVPLELRIESLRSIEMVDEVRVIETTIEELLLEIKPDYVLKGREHENSANPEAVVIESYGGSLIFGSGDFTLSSTEYMETINHEKHFAESVGREFLTRHKIESSKLRELISKISTLNVLVIGDLIIDEYISCESVGLSQEDPSVIFRPLETQKFVGGAGIVGLHARSLGAMTTFVSVVGEDLESDFARTHLASGGVNLIELSDGLRKTVLKQRFRARGKTHFRINHFDDGLISNKTRSKLVSICKDEIDKCDLVIFSDFNYGVLDSHSASELISHASKKAVFIAADCQISSQIADYTKYKGVDLLTPTEHECRVTLRNNVDGLAAIATDFQRTMNCKNLLLTLGADGVLIQDTTFETNLITDLLPDLSNASSDVAGAGDSFLVLASMTLALGGTLAEAAFLGSIAAAIQVNRVGNTPLKLEEILEGLQK
jgi:rfaE bifunctional protein kinase chain/domain